MFFDALGRTTKTVANYTGNGTVSASTPDENVTVEMTYHSSGQLSTLTAKNPTTGDQVTKYVYGTAKAWIAPVIYRNDLLCAEIYPDSDDTENISQNILQNGSDGVADRVEFLYNRAGETIAKRDQNGTVHNYEYDNLGRILHDRITTLASGIDGTVRRISTVYDVVGNVKSLTSYNNANVGSGTVVNQVLYEFNANGQLSNDYSNPSGSVNVVSTPCISYTYDVTKLGEYFTKGLRPATVTYPSGKVLTYVYGTLDSNDDKLNRCTAIMDDNTTVVTYTHNGVMTPTTVTYNQPGLTLDYTGGIDNFNRITDHAWKQSTTDIVRIKHGYDRVGNRLYREDGVNGAFSEMYSYDGVNQLIGMQRGQLDATKSGVMSRQFAENFAFDATGNWDVYERDNDGDGTWDVNQQRAHNKANEIVCLGGTHTYVAHDRNGNMTKVPQPNSTNSCCDLTFDAWNRLTQVKDGNTIVATYSYNGLNHRVKKVVGTETRLFCFNWNWQCLEERVGSMVDLTYSWGLRYVDDLIYRDKNAERLYSLADPNWNVVALCDTSGAVKERMVYDAFGKANWCDASFGAKTTSSYSWNRTFTGQVLDGETELMLYRNRFYHNGVGRFVVRDMIKYRANDLNIYRYVYANPLKYNDVYGLMTCNAGNEGSRYCDTIQTVFTPGSDKPGSQDKLLNIAILLLALSSVPEPSWNIGNLIMSTPLSPAPHPLEVTAALAKLKSFNLLLKAKAGLASVWSEVICYECKAINWFQCLRGKTKWGWKEIGKSWTQCDLGQTEFGQRLPRDRTIHFIDDDSIFFKALTKDDVNDLRSQCQKQAEGIKNN